jgi:hypothetical protein
MPGSEFSSCSGRTSLRADAWLVICAIGNAIDETRVEGCDKLIEQAIAKPRIWIEAVR